MKRLFAFALAAIWGGGILAAERDWSGLGNDADWNNTANWAGDSSGSWVFSNASSKPEAARNNIASHTTVTFTNAVSVSEDVWMEYGMTFTAEDASNGLTINNSKEFKLGCDNSTFTIDGGYYSFTTMVRGSSGDKTVTLDLKGGTLQTKFTQYNSSGGTTAGLNVLFNGGTVKAAAESSDFFMNGTGSSSGAVTVKVGANGGTFDTATYNVTVSQRLDAVTDGATGTLEKTGTGTLTLSGAVNVNLKATAGTIALGENATIGNVNLTLAGGTFMSEATEQKFDTVTVGSGYTFKYADLPAASNYAFADGATLIIAAPESEKSYSVFLASGASEEKVTVIVTGTDKACTVSWDATNGLTITPTDTTATTAYWLGGATDEKWSTKENWSTCVAPASDSVKVVFPAGTHSVTLAYNDTGNDKCGEMVVDGDVTISRASGDWAYFSLNGNISGSGSLTLKEVGILNDSGNEITASCAVVVDGSGNNDTFFSTKAWKFTGDFKVAANGYLKADNVAITVTGNATLEGGAKIELYKDSASAMFKGKTTMSGIVTKYKQKSNANSRGTLTFNEIEVTAAAELKYQYDDSGTTAFNGAVAIADGATFTISPASEKVEFGDDFSVKVPANASSSPLTISNNTINLSSKTITITGTLDTELEYSILTAASGSSGKAAIEVDDPPEKGAWSTKWVDGEGGTKVLKAYYVGPGFVIIIADAKVPLDQESGLTTWLTNNNVGVDSAEADDFLATQNSKGISPLAAYLLGYTEYSNTTDAPALTASVLGDSFTLAYDLTGKTSPAPAIDGIALQYGIATSSDNETWSDPVAKTTTPHVTLAFADAGLYNKLVANIVAN